MPEQPGVERLALSPMQKGMLYHHLTGGPADVDLQQILVTLPEALDIDRLRAAWERVVDRHPTLRSSFDWEDRGPPRRVVQPAVRLPFEVTDLESLDRVGREEGLADLIATRRSQAFQPGNAPLFSVDLVRFGADDFTLLWSFHHLIMDGHSTALVLEELFLVYEALAGDHEPALELVAPYSEFLDWLDARERSEDREYWTRALDTFDGATPLPGELGAAARPAPAGPPLEEEELRLGGEETTRLARFAEGLELTLNALIQAAWAVVLSRFSGATDVVYGVTRTARSRDLARSDAMVGVLIQTYPVRVEVEADRPVGQWLRGLKDAHRAMGDRFLTDLPAVQACSGVSPGAPLFQSLYMYDHQEMTTSLRGLGGAWARREVRILERPPYPMTLYAYGEPELRLRIVSDPGRIEPGTPSRLLDLLRHVLGELSRDAERPVRSALGLPDAEQARLVSLGSGTALRLEDQPLVHQQILARGAHHSDEIALVAGDRSTTYRELADSVRRCANGLRQRGVGPGMIVGLEGDRSIETVTCLLAVLETGAAYLPLDPSYPESRLRFMADDFGVSHIVIGPGAHMAWGDDFDTVPARELLTSDSAVTPAGGSVGARDLAYVIYTSGSTGRPKGVMVEHGNVRNFLAAMDEAVSQGTPKTWLSVTPLSFDISVLELLWTLSRGWRVALPTPGPGPGAADVTPMTDPSRAEARSAGSASASIGRKADTAFGLFFFAAASGEQAGDGYRLLLEGARKADALGFASIWTPERHFHEFGGLYPNPSVTGAALAAITRNLAIRAGSVVLPLHDPIRVAEEWSLVDNVSGGRAGVAFASGWQRNDFVLAPDNYHNRHEEMYRAIEIVQRLWRGEEVNVPGVDGEQVGVRLYPRPVQPMLPMWLTAAGSPETFRKAREIGAGVLTHLLGQSVEDLAELLDTYREARRTAGHRPGHGHVTVMLHAFVGEDDEEVRDLVRTPLREHLRSSVSLIKNYSGVWASRKGDGGAQAEGDEFEKLPPADLEAILDQAFERYYETSGLLGPADKCADLVQRLATVGVNEIACLVDFGVATDLALDGIDNIAALGRMLSPAASAMTQHTVRPAGLATADRGEAGQTETESEAPRPADAMMDVPGLIGRHDVTHMQCTPSLLRMLLADADGRTALAALDVLLVGGEAFPGTLAQEVAEITDARIVNMYGPTETTVWSATGPAGGADGGTVPIGHPVANTRLYVLDSDGALLPSGSPGELYIGGDGVARGYFDRPDLTAQRFVPDPFSDGTDARMYRTGDRARWRPDGALEFLGRTDQQVKLRGHRVELGEIEAALRLHHGVAHVAVVLRGDGSDGALVAFYVPSDEDPGAAELRTWLGARLPGVMIPSLWESLAELPLTPNGKIDRNALPEVAVDPRARPIEADTVDALVEIWSEVLGVADVGRDDDFFELGGNSLSTIQVAFQIRKAFGVELPLRTFFRAPTVAQLAARIEEEMLDQADVNDLAQLVAEMEDLSDEEAAQLVGQE